MKKRPLSFILIGLLFMISGTVGLVYHLLPQHIHELPSGHGFHRELLLVCFIRLLAVVGGLFLMLGYGWARWLLAVWMLYHVVLSLFHSWSEVAVHAALFSVICFFLFRRRTGRVKVEG